MKFHSFDQIFDQQQKRLFITVVIDDATVLDFDSKESLIAAILEEVKDTLGINPSVPFLSKNGMLLEEIEVDWETVVCRVYAPDLKDLTIRIHLEVAQK